MPMPNSLNDVIELNKLAVRRWLSCKTTLKSNDAQTGELGPRAQSRQKTNQTDVDLETTATSKTLQRNKLVPNTDHIQPSTMSRLESICADGNLRNHNVARNTKKIMGESHTAANFVLIQHRSSLLAPFRFTIEIGARFTTTGARATSPVTV